MSETKALHIHQFDPELKARLIEAARDDKVSLNMYAARVLAEHFNVRFAASGRVGSNASVIDGALNIPVPLPLYRKIHQAALYESKRAVVEGVFRDHFAAIDAEHAGATATA